MFRRIFAALFFTALALLATAAAADKPSDPGFLQFRGASFPVSEGEAYRRAVQPMSDRDLAETGAGQGVREHGGLDAGGDVQRCAEWGGYPHRR